jgi:hypothetical protein
MKAASVGDVFSECKLSVHMKPRGIRPFNGVLPILLNEARSLVIERSLCILGPPLAQSSCFVVFCAIVIEGVRELTGTISDQLTIATTRNLLSSHGGKCPIRQILRYIWTIENRTLHDAGGKNDLVATISLISKVHTSYKQTTKDVRCYSCQAHLPKAVADRKITRTFFIGQDLCLLEIHYLGE